MRKILIAVFLCLWLIFLVYLSFPTGGFPLPPSDALQSGEPGDTETPLRRAYFTNYTRDEVLVHYKTIFGGLFLNYPPEEAQVLIRDQTRSTFLQELVVPFLRSVYINGFEPLDEKDAILIGGSTWRQKLIVRLVDSNPIVSLTVFTLALGLSLLVIRNFLKVTAEVVVELRRIWSYR